MSTFNRLPLPLRSGIILYLLVSAVIPQLGTGGTVGTGQTLILIAFGILGFIFACVATTSSFEYSAEVALIATIFFGLALLGEGSGWSLLIPFHLIAGWLLAVKASGLRSASDTGGGNDDQDNGQ